MRHFGRLHPEALSWSFRIALTAALHGFRHYRATALLLGSAVLSALCTALPLASLFGGPEGRLGLRLVLRPWPGGDLGLHWLMGMAGPSIAQQEAVSRMGIVLLLSLCGTLLVGVTTVLTFGAARLAERRVERLVRRAVGASRRTLLGSALVELVAFAAIPGLAGGLIAKAVAHSAAMSWPGNLTLGTGDLTIVVTMLLMIVLTAIVLGPAIFQRRAIRQAEMHVPLPTFPVVLQVAICFAVLSTGTILASRAKQLSITRPQGLENGTVVSISSAANEPRQRSEQLRHLLDSLERDGMHSVSLTSPGTLMGLGYVGMVMTDCGQCTEGGLGMSVRLKPATHKIVSADTFRLTGLPVLAGRGITPEDDWDAPPVAVVSRSLAAREFQNGNPIGRRIYTADDEGKGSTVVGVVADRLPLGLGGSLQPRYAVYVSVLQHPPGMVDLLVRDRVDDQTLVDVLGSALGTGSGSYTLTTEAALQEAEIAPVRWFGRLFTLQGWGLLGLAAFGIAAFMVQWVKSLRGEIAIRRSVGARRHHIQGWVLWQAIGVATKGILAGVWFGLAIWNTLPEVVTGATPSGPCRFLPQTVLILGLILSGVLPTAWRLSRARPAELLQSPGA